MTEKQWEAVVVKLLKLHKWRVYHSWSSIHSPAGFPDLLCVRDNRVLAIELKSEKGRVSHSQDEWLRSLSGVKVVDAFVLRPAEDLSELEEMLR